MRATVLADFAAREHENAQLLDDARERETERSRLTDQLHHRRAGRAAPARERAARRRGAVAFRRCALARRGAELDRRRAAASEAREIIGRALERHRATIGQLRSLSFNLEPVVLRDQGFAPAVREITDQIGSRTTCASSWTSTWPTHGGEDAGRAVPDHPRSSEPSRAPRAAADAVGDDARRLDDGSIETTIADDAPGERRRSSLEELAERARTLNGVLTVDQGDTGGTTVRVVLPPYATAR